MQQAGQQLAAFVSFLRWSANFQQDEICQHPNHKKVMLLSPMQSARFAFGFDGDTLMLGVQDFESVWFASMPFKRAYVSDRLYLSVDGTNCVDTELPALALGVFVDDPRKCDEMSKARILQPVAIGVRDGQVTSVGRTLGLGIPIEVGDIVQALNASRQEKLRKQDIQRFL